ncbi:MAG: insulinase family protein [Flavobacteriales bacterium]|nr:insulinase family protein [Flavobacteriales bacterium]
MLDRTQSPSFGKIESIDLMEPKVFHLDNGLPVFCIDAGAQEVLKIELVFRVGTATSDKKLVASSTANLLTSGTKHRSAHEIAESVDFYGSHLQTEVSHDECSLSLYTLNKHVERTITTLAEVYSEPTFPEREVETYMMNNRQEMLVNEEKVSYLAAKAFSSTLFGSDHPYGRSADLDDYNQIDRSELVDFHAAFIKDCIAYILVAGKRDEKTIGILNAHFGKSARKSNSANDIPKEHATQSSTHVAKAGAVQNSIKIGRVLFNRTHADFVGMQILSTVLGGYFGSRLMANIREDKGYTYGIGAGVASLQHSGYLTISTEVGSDVCDAAINEIYFEIERLRKHLIPINELELVRNYLLGSILKSIDGPFEIAGKWKGYMKYDLGISAHHDFIRQIKTITPEHLRELANKYLQKHDLVQVTVGSGK